MGEKLPDIVKYLVGVRKSGIGHIGIEVCLSGVGFLDRASEQL